MSAPVIAGLTAVFLAAIKFSAGAMSGSMAVLSSAIDSLLDCLVSILNYFALKKSAKNPNDKFNFGYGKIEALVALIEGAFIVGIGVFVAYSSVKRFFEPNSHLNAELGIAVMAVCAVITGLLVLYLRREFTKSGNLILKADTLHYQSDLITNLATLGALFIAWISGFSEVDLAFGLGISVFIVFSALKLLKEGVYMLLDGALEPKIIEQIIEIINAKLEITSFHYLKTRKSGDTNYFSVHLVFDPKISLANAHKIGDILENEIKNKFTSKKWDFELHFDVEDDSTKEN